MATITKRGDTFRIKVSLGYDTEHKQIIKSTTFKPPQGVTPKKAEKLAQQFAYALRTSAKTTPNSMRICVFLNSLTGILRIMPLLS